MKRNLLFLGLTFVTLMAVATSCTCRHEFVSVHDYIANNSGHKVTLTSDRKTVTIANDSTVFIGEALSQCACPNFGKGWVASSKIIYQGIEKKEALAHGQRLLNALLCIRFRPSPAEPVRWRGLRCGLRCRCG